ncbi:MAG: DUF2948 family protein [Alphaproteobacteria bacterium]|nr:DUF2948 family protein [Alphaproteobacteria bacterium]
MSQAPLRLKAVDAEDLATLSALLQDALIELGKFTLVRRTGRFSGPLVRFMHEERPRPRVGPLRQTACTLAFVGVRSVRSRGLDPKAKGRPLELLALLGSEDGRTIDLVFAGGGGVRLEVDAIDGRIEDVGEPWMTTLRPRHSADLED